MRGHYQQGGIRMAAPPPTAAPANACGYQTIAGEY